MSSRLALGAYWKPRRESIEQCADRLFVFMHALTLCDFAFSQWFKLGHSRRDALKGKVNVQSREELFALLDKGRHRRDIGKAVMEELGFSVSLWNGGEEGKDAGLSVKCGLYWVSPSPNASLSNCVTLDFPEDFGGLTNPANASRVLSVAASCWEPDWAGISSSESRSARDWWKQPFVDWMVYVPRKIASVPPPSTVTHLENGGSLIVVQPNPPVLANPEDQARIRIIEQIVRP